ncbi:SEC-C domain-containing protein [Mycobacterium botniense]|uniref:Zinc-binding protein n=1 Tax=Mycobacterium botniense TaxID=84962 RepID=A0A7I9XT75_9MYCO|nr:SEC-C domain-containing protein [Mycobacterium botniense]GFG73211.1 hypothetical protein MBOT_05760 [Mycobacterium botniense]
MATTLDATATIAELLAEHGPLHLDDIAARLRQTGQAEPDPLLGEVLDEISCPARQLVDDRWVWLPALLSGRTFTHRLGAAEIAHDILTVTPDLDPISTLCEHEQYRRLADGSPARVVLEEFDGALLQQRGIPAGVIDPNGALLLAPGTLRGLGVAEGDLLGVRLDEQGLVVERVATPRHAAEVAARLAATLDGDEPVYFAAAVWTACAADPSLLREPAPPLGELVGEHALAQRGEWLAPAGFDFDRWFFERGCVALAERHDLDPDDAVALYTLLQIYDQLSLLIAAADADADEPPAETLAAAAEDMSRSQAEQILGLVGELGAVLAEPLLAEVLVAETVGTGRAGAAALGVFAGILEPRVPRAARVACRWLRAVALERIGDIEGAEGELLAAESLDPNWPLPLLDLARIASDRGDAERGLALLRRADAEPDHPLVELLELHRAEPRRDLGRNELCWCGSGRKYKKCHLGREQLPLTERAGWLYAKAIQHTLRSGWNDLLVEVGYERARYSADDPDALEAALGDPLVIDAVLFEGGAFAEFVAVRGSLLPDDERLLAEQWLLMQRSVFEVEQVRPGQGVTVRDVRTGDRHQVRERLGSRQLKAGQLVCTRVLPAGDSSRFFGGVEPVGLHQRDALIDLLDTGPDPVTLVAWLSRRFAPPALVNTEGDPLALCEASVRPADPVALLPLLDDTYDRVEGDRPPRWFEHVTTGGMQRIRANLALEDDTLRVETNSEMRMDRVLATLARLDPAMTVLEDSRRPIPTIRDAAKLAGQLPSSGADALEPDDPEVAAVVENLIRRYEAAWLDEPIPALAGHTPRQAADDPTRRGDLIKLLDTFPAGESARGGMDADRLRAALRL